ncbi:hypothetical protein VNO77_23416 [Canavalia gladiata]|uniref:Uncharacterized protein n=1 Tax=Canavalia gladiata TaxID=3824 RepID=A0AAN9L7R7_CANGL
MDGTVNTCMPINIKIIVGGCLPIYSLYDLQAVQFQKNNNKPYKCYHTPYYHNIKENMYKLQGSLPYTPVCSVTNQYHQL